MEDRRDDQALTERSLIVAADDRVHVWRDVRELHINAILQVFRLTAYRPTKLSAEKDLAFVIKSVPQLGINRVRSFERFDVPRVYACDDLVLGLGEHLARIHIIMFGHTRTHAHERNQVANLIVRQARNKA